MNDKTSFIAPGTIRDKRIARILGLIENSPTVRRHDLAQLLGLSVWHFAHLFKRETGLQLNGYLREARLQHATRLLISTNEPIKAIAFAVGYEHSSSFIRAFLLRFGESPERYRQRSEVFWINDVMPVPKQN